MSTPYTPAGSDISMLPITVCAITIARVELWIPISKELAIDWLGYPHGARHRYPRSRLHKQVGDRAGDNDHQKMTDADATGVPDGRPGRKCLPPTGDEINPTVRRIRWLTGLDADRFDRRSHEVPMSGRHDAITGLWFSEFNPAPRNRSVGGSGEPDASTMPKRPASNSRSEQFDGSRSWRGGEVTLESARDRGRHYSERDG